MSKDMTPDIFFELWGPDEKRLWEPFEADLAQIVKKVDMEEQDVTIITLRETATKLIDAMEHDSVCLFITAQVDQECTCGTWEATIMARGELVKLLRNNPQPPSSTD